MTHTAKTIARVVSAARQAMTLPRETVRAAVDFDRQLTHVQRFTVLTLPR